jgi:hypothetical protein
MARELVVAQGLAAATTARLNDFLLRRTASIEATDPTALESVYNVAFGMEGRLNVLSSHDRVGLWGLCPT